jgi:hypothetical protein
VASQCAGVEEGQSDGRLLEVIGVRNSGISVGIGCAAFVVVFSAGSYASWGIAFLLNGIIPVFFHALNIVPLVNAFSRALE